MISTKGLGPTQKRMLTFLFDHGQDPLTPMEIAEALPENILWRKRRQDFVSAYTPRWKVSPEAVTAALRGLERRGMAERLGESASGARTWSLTEAGRSVVLPPLPQENTEGETR